MADDEADTRGSDVDGWVLAIETSNPSSGVDRPASSVAGATLDAPGQPGGVIERWFEPASRHEDGLMPAIEGVRDELGVDPTGLRRVCVSIGPGGYTGLRVATTTAMLLAESTGAELVGVPSACVAAHRAVADGVDEPFAVCLASKRGVTHATVFEDPSDLGPGREAGLIDESGVAGLGVRVFVGDRHFPSPIRLRINDLGFMIREPRLDAAACLTLGVRLPPVQGRALIPTYAREPEAVRLWKGRPPRTGS
jgi:tRNA threonylcarbamoyl adenosine modification protein YeaZ